MDRRANIEINRFRDNGLLSWYTDVDYPTRWEAEEYLKGYGYRKVGCLWHKRLEDGVLVAVVRSW